MLRKIKHLVNTEDKKRLVSNFFSLSALQIFSYILPLITLPYLFRVLGADKFGLIVFAQAFIGYFSIIVDYGFNLSATREISIHRDNKEKLTEIFSSVMSIKFILLVISFFILVCVTFIFEKFNAEQTLYLLTFLTVASQLLFPVWYFQGIENMKYITIINIISKIFFTVMIFVLIQDVDDYLYVPLLTGAGALLGGLFSLWIIFGKFKQKVKVYKISTLKYYFVNSSHFFLSRVGVLIYTTSNIVILGMVTTNSMVGYYAIAEKLYQAMQRLYHPLVNVLYPYVTKERNIKLFKKIFTIVNLLNVFIVVVLFLGTPLLIEFITGSRAEESIIVFRVFLIVSLIVVPSILLGYPFLAALGYKNYANNSILFASLVHMTGLGILYLFNLVNIYNVALMLIITESTVFIIRLYAINNYNLWSEK